MKKFFMMAVMALTVGFFASCAVGGSGDYKQGDPAPSIDTEKGTVNGKQYDTDVEHCWRVVATLKVGNSKTQSTYYRWDTEFDVHAEFEMAAWTSAQAGTPYTYIAVIVSAKDSEDCLSKNDKN